MRPSILRVTFLTAAATLAAFTTARAGGGQPVGVMERLRPAYDAKGLPVGSFRLRPALDVGAAYDDNVYRTPTIRIGDSFVTINPSLTLRSEWSRHMLELSTGMTQYLYQSRTSENRRDWYVGADGRLDILRGVALNGDASYNVLHEPRYSPDQPGGAAEPTQYSVLHAGSSLRYQPGRVGIEVGGRFDHYYYDPTKLVGGGYYYNADRNRNQYRATAKVSYEFSPGYALFLRGAYDDRKFATNLGAQRDSQGYRADAGAEMFLTHLVQGQIFVGFARQVYKGPYSNANALDYGAKLIWYATPLMTVHLSAARNFTDTTIPFASVSDDQTGRLSVDYELLRDLILQAHVDFTDSRFVGTPRNDKLFEAGLTANYLINRYMSANAGYAYQHRSSSQPGNGFTDSLVQAGLHFQM